MKKCKLKEFIEGDNEVIVCDVDSHQKQSFFICCNDAIFYVRMGINGNVRDYHTHKDSIEHVYDLFEKYPNEPFMFCDVEYLEGKSFYREIAMMKDFEIKYVRDYKINKLLKENLI